MPVAASLLPELDTDHACWLLVVAKNYLDQRSADRAIVLLELLGLLDPQNTQGQILLAYAYLIGHDQPRLKATLNRLASLPLTPGDRDALSAIRSHQGAEPPGHSPWRALSNSRGYRISGGENG